MIEFWRANCFDVLVFSPLFSEWSMVAPGWFDGFDVVSGGGIWLSCWGV